MLPYLEFNINNHDRKFAPFMSTDIDPYGAFANSTVDGKYPITQTEDFGQGKTTTYEWPSSERAYHAQKILYLKRKINLVPEDYQKPQELQKVLDEMLEELETPFRSPRAFLPSDYEDIVNNFKVRLNKAGLETGSISQDPNSHVNDFDKHCGADYHPVNNNNVHDNTSEFMRTVVRLKLQQYPALAKIAMECFKNHIIPLEVTEDGNWGVGVDGKGFNRLGCIIGGVTYELLQQTDPKNYSEDRKPEAFQNWFQNNILLYSTDVLCYANLKGKLNPYVDSPAPEWKNTVESYDGSHLKPDNKRAKELWNDDDFSKVWTNVAGDNKAYPMSKEPVAFTTNLSQTVNIFGNIISGEQLGTPDGKDYLQTIQKTRYSCCCKFRCVVY